MCVILGLWVTHNDHVQNGLKSNDSDATYTNTRLPDNNQERRPITTELNLNAVTLFDGESLPGSS